jgi:hypothetical protein
MKPTHLRTPRTLDEACFVDCSYQSPIERRISSGLDVLFAIALGLIGAAVLFYGLSL